MSQNMEISEQLTLEDLEGFSLFAGDSLAKTYPWLASVKAWLATSPDSSSTSCVSLLMSFPAGFLSKTSLAFCHLTWDGIWEPYSGRWENSGIGGPTVALTLNTLEYPKDADESTLSAILEPRVHPKYSLSPKACMGILRRAEQRGRKLPKALEDALTAVATKAETP